MKLELADIEDLGYKLPLKKIHHIGYSMNLIISKQESKIAGKEVRIHQGDFVISYQVPTKYQLQNDYEVWGRTSQIGDGEEILVSEMKSHARLAYDSMLTMILEEGNFSMPTSVTRRNFLRRGPLMSLKAYLKDGIMRKLEKDPSYSALDSDTKKGIVLVRTEKALDILAGFFEREYGTDYGLRLLSAWVGLSEREKKAYFEAVMR